MIKIVRPFKNATKASITQGFIPKEHEANDFAGNYGEDLVAPFTCKILSIVESPEKLVLEENNEPLLRGYGIRMQSTEDPTLSITYWHCLPIFPVDVGDYVDRGKPVAEMGNSGFVLAGWRYVEVDRRTKPPYPGTHVHISFGRTNAGGSYTPLDYQAYIDWIIPINYDMRTFLMAMFKKILNVLKGR